MLCLELNSSKTERVQPQCPLIKKDIAVTVFVENITLVILCIAECAYVLVSVYMFICASVCVWVCLIKCVCVFYPVLFVCVYSIMCVCVYRECSSTTCWVSSGWPSSSLAVRDSRSPGLWRCGSSHGEKATNERQNIPAGRRAHNYTPMHRCTHTHIYIYTHTRARTHTRMHAHTHSDCGTSATTD